MAFCTRCGKQIEEGQVCSCSVTAGKNFEKVKEKVNKAKEDSKGIYERGQKIIPQNICSNEGEIPIRQYNLAVLRSRIKFMRAEGRMQVTNKRLIFRAPGRSLMGKTTLQHEFAIDDIAGLEIRKDYRFSFWDLLLGLYIALGFFYSVFMVSPLGSGFSATQYDWPSIGIQSNFNGDDYGYYNDNNYEYSDGYTDDSAMYSENYKETESKPNYNWIGIVISFGFAIAGIYLIFKMKRKFLLKSFLCSVSASCFFLASTYVTSALLLSDLSGFMIAISGIFTVIFRLAGILSALGVIVFGVLFAFKPNLVIDIKVKGGTSPIQIRRKKKGLAGGLKGISSDSDYTGYNEVMPWHDTDIAIREIGAMISDIQILGDLGVRKWIQR